MILCKVFFILAATASFAWANLRAPVHIERAGSALKAETAALKILGETLEFHCPQSHTGKMDFELFATRACDARVRYRILAEKTEQVKLTFVFSGSGNVIWRQGTKIQTVASRSMKIDDRKTCLFCPDSMKTSQIAEQAITFEKGESELEISYRQALSYDERGHGYFSDGKWTQGFTYELWPIAEWQWAESVTAEIKFSIGARPGFLGIGYKDDRMQCFIEENGALADLSLAVGKLTEDRRTATGSLKLARKPQRLRCSYATD